MIKNGKNVAGEVGDELIMRGEMEELLSLQDVAEYLQKVKQKITNTVERTIMIRNNFTGENNVFRTKAR